MLSNVFSQPGDMSENVFNKLCENSPVGKGHCACQCSVKGISSVASQHLSYHRVLIMETHYKFSDCKVSFLYLSSTAVTTELAPQSSQLLQAVISRKV